MKPSEALLGNGEKVIQSAGEGLAEAGKDMGFSVGKEEDMTHVEEGGRFEWSGVINVTFTYISVDFAN